MKLFKPYLFVLLGFMASLLVTLHANAQIEFIENKGQWDSRVKFMSEAGSGSFFLQEDGFTVSQYNPRDVESIKEKKLMEALHVPMKNGAGKIIHTQAYNVKFLNAEKPVILPDKVLPTINNYFIGNNPSKWASNCKIYQGVT